MAKTLSGFGRYRWLPWLVGVGAAAVLVFALRPQSIDSPASSDPTSEPIVGADLHSLVVDPRRPDRIYIGSHDGVSVSEDGGGTWKSVPSLVGADAMGWAFTEEAILVGGHPGINVSTDGGKTFEQRNGGLPTTDVHALGAGKSVIYAGLAGAGTYASTDGGETWEVRSEEVGGAFMGRILVDPRDEDHVLAPDMQLGVVESTDGGRTWNALGDTQGAMWVSWDESDVDHIVVTVMGQALESVDGGDSWTPVEIPAGASIVEFSPHEPDLWLAAVLEAPRASLYVSTDGGDSWTRP